MFQWIDHGYWYDKKDSSKLELLDCLLLTAMSPAESSGRSEVTPRFLRHMNILTMDQFDDVTLRRIFQTEIDWHFKVEHIKQLQIRNKSSNIILINHFDYKFNSIIVDQ